MLNAPSAPLTTPGHIPGSEDASGVHELAAAATRIPHSFAAAYVESVRVAHPTATPSEVTYLLQRRYQFALGMGGVMTGLTALRPMGTTTAAAVTAAHLASAAGASSLYLLALCQIYGVTEPTAIQHTLAQCVLGDDGIDVIETHLGLGVSSWYSATLARLPVSHVRWTTRIANRSLAKAARKGGVSRTAAALPIGIGVTLGFASGRLLAQRVIDAARAHLGPPPAHFPALVPTLYSSPTTAAATDSSVASKES